MRQAKSINTRLLINQWSLAFRDLGDIWTVIEYLRLSHEWFHLDEALVLFTAYFSPKTPSILSTASISNVRPPGTCICQGEREAAWDWPGLLFKETVTSKQALLGVQGHYHWKPGGALTRLCIRAGRAEKGFFCWDYGRLRRRPASGVSVSFQDVYTFLSVMQRLICFFIKNRWKVCNVLYAIHVYMFRVIVRFFDIWSLRCMLYFLSLGRFCLITLLSELFHNCACLLSLRLSLLLSVCCSV